MKRFYFFNFFNDETGEPELGIGLLTPRGPKTIKMPPGMDRDEAWVQLVKAEDALAAAERRLVEAHQFSNYLPGYMLGQIQDAHAAAVQNYRDYAAFFLGALAALWPNMPKDLEAAIQAMFISPDDAMRNGGPGTEGL